MKNTGISFVIASLILAGSLSAAVQAPVLKWSRAGCTAWCETGWYSSPAVADLDRDGVKEIIAASYTVSILTGDSGRLISSFNQDNGRVWSGVITADINADSSLEIIVSSNGCIIVRDSHGDSLWTQATGAGECRGLAAADLDSTGYLNIIATAAVSDSMNTWIFSHNGAFRPGWPQRSGTDGYSWGVYNNNAAVGDLDGAPGAEIVVPSDVHYICAYHADASALDAASLFGDKTWGQVGVWADTAPEHRGWGGCDGSPVESYRANFATGAAVIADVDNDDNPEVVVTGNVYDCSDPGYPSRYTGLFIFNPDRTRFKRGAFDWSVPPAGSGVPISEDYGVIESCMPDPVVADIDGDEMKEILFSSYDGKVHAFYLDGTEHDQWPFSVYNAADGYLQFASPPVVADLDNNGKAEVLFTTWTEKTSGHTGSLYILDYLGNMLQCVSLPDTALGRTWNGALASPTIDLIGSSSNYSIVIATATGGFAAYELPGTASARILWGTGRANYCRTGNIFSGDHSAISRPAVPGSTTVRQAGSITLNLGGPVTRISVPFAVDKGFGVKIYDIRGRNIPCAVMGTKVTVSVKSAGLLIVRVKSADGRHTAAAKVIR